MALETKIQTGGSVAGQANVDAGFNLACTLPTNGQYAGFAISCSQLDDGAISGTPDVRSIDVNSDFKLRTGNETLYDLECFDYTAQNTGKHNYITTTMTMTWNTNGLTTNGSSITTINTGAQFRTYAMFPTYGTTDLYLEFEGSFSAQPVTNTTLLFGAAIPAAATPFTLVDGACFRLTVAGLVCVISSNGTETVSPPIDWTGIDGSATYTINKKYQFIIQISERSVLYWIDNFLVYTIDTPDGQGRPFMAAALSLVIAHAIGGTIASGVFQFTVNSYTVSLGGPNPGDTLAVIGSRILGTYQGLSGGTMGSLASYANSANPTAAVPTNTTAALGTGLGGQFWETATLAVNTDGIIWSYQIPMGTINIQGRRLSLKGIYLYSYIQTVIAGGPFCCQYSLAFGHTAVSLATTETAIAKAPRRIALPTFTQVVTAAQAVSTLVSQPGGSFIDLGDAGIIVNPGEFIALVTKHVGTVGTSGTIAHISQPIYGWI
jgi:hypothetical protein